MVNLLDRTAAAKPSGSYSGYQEPDTRIPPKARPLFKDITVNGIVIAESDILAEAQNHPSATPGEALEAAARALVIRQLLLQRAASVATDLPGEADVEDGRSESVEERAIGELLDREIETPTANEEECRRFYDRNPARFRSDTIHEARHILIAAAAENRQAREDARRRAEGLIALLAGDPEAFADLALEHSDCPSRENGGNLGQLTKGSTVRDFEQALLAMRPGETSREPVETRYGYHVIRLERRIDGEPLPFDLVRERIAGWLEAATWSKAVSQYIAILATEADIVGIDLLSGNGRASGLAGLE